MRPSSFRALVGVAVAIGASGVRPAAACGGTFCDTGPTAMPVDQTGENVVFSIDDGFVEAHVQILYQGDPARFAWIVPMQQVPDVHPGSAQLFANALAGTVPTYGFSVQRAQCNSNTQRGVLTSGSDNSISVESDGGSAGGVHVVFEKVVGAFQVDVLKGGTADEVVTWLSQNGYQNADAAPAILQRYVDKGFVFVAVKLTAGAGLDEIHPLVFRYAGSEPCVPLELTSIAAVPDMNVRTFFFGSDRVVPTSYRHVVLNQLKIDWLSLGANYDDVVSKAIDEKGADGNAFITEYAGPSNVVQTQGLVDSRWNASRLAATTPFTVVTELDAQGFVSCDLASCNFLNPLVLPLLEQYLPSPVGVDPRTFYAQLVSSAPDTSKWNAAQFAADVDDRIIQPAVHAADIVNGHPYLTRLFTRISPEEMTADPVFAVVKGLGDVRLPAPATENIGCTGAGIMSLPDGTEVALGRPPAWPRFDGMPAAARVEDFSSGSSKPAVVSDSTAQITEGLRSYNAAHGVGTDPGGCGCHVPGTGSRGVRDDAMLSAAAALGVLARRRRRKSA